MHQHGADSGLTTRQDLDRRLDQHRGLILGSLDGLAEDPARAVPVPGKPSLLGIVRHTAYVEGVWFGEAVTGRPRAELGLPVATANSWKTRRTDTIASVTQLCQRIHEHSRSNLAGLGLDDMVTGRGRRTVRSLYTHVLIELAWNTGQLDILRPLADAAQRPAES
ncbi:DinB family protein [Microbacterium sp. M28]|uniref:DinB family protein n=1 Tax=Microbacterium sp. M28 TaxID=2962064 RepID=UPI0021F42790|nr:DinB family protein [Microbacterium sp. M28]UYO96496.1 DinB family protein [Microbacterium sp. M28]